MFQRVPASAVRVEPPNSRRSSWSGKCLSKSSGIFSRRERTRRPNRQSTEIIIIRLVSQAAACNLLICEIPPAERTEHDTALRTARSQATAKLKQRDSVFQSLSLSLAPCLLFDERRKLHSVDNSGTTRDGWTTDIGSKRSRQSRAKGRTEAIR